MKDINDQPQELLARYADRTGAKFEYQHPLKMVWYSEVCDWTAKRHFEEGHRIRLALTYGLPSHLKAYKENPRDPGEGYRVPAWGESANQKHEFYSLERKWQNAILSVRTFENFDTNYRLPATVMPPDWKDMTREEVQPEPKAWIPHTGDEMPCDGERLVDVKLIHPYTAHPAKLGKLWSWNSRVLPITHWRYADEEPSFEENVEYLLNDYRIELIRDGHALSLLDRVETALNYGSEGWRNVEELKVELAMKTDPAIGVLRPISEMPADVPEGCVRHWCEFRDGIIMNRLTNYKGMRDTHAVDIRLPVAPDPLAEERAKFEAWAKSDALFKEDYTFGILDDGRYIGKALESAWRAWRAAKGI